MMLINIFCVLLLVGVFHNTMEVPRRHSSNEWKEEIPTEREAPEYGTKSMRSIHITYIYEINKDTKLSSSALRNKIVQAVGKLNDNLHKRRIKFTTEDIRPFKNTGKPLAKYNAEELSRFLNNDSYFKKLSANTDNTQIIAFGDLTKNENPFQVPRSGHGSQHLKMHLRGYYPDPFPHVLHPKTNKQNRPFAVTTYKDICSKESRGVIVVHQETALTVARFLSFNFACAAGIYDKRACLRGFREDDMKSFKCMHDQLCFLPKLRLYEKNWAKINNLCERNTRIHDPAVIEGHQWVDNELADADESDSTNIIYIALGVLAGVVLLLPAPIVIYLWIDRNKTKKLTKDRVSVNYKYDPMNHTGRPSIVTDPRVTNDLE